MKDISFEGFGGSTSEGRTDQIFGSNLGFETSPSPDAIQQTFSIATGEVCEIAVQPNLEGFFVSGQALMIAEAIDLDTNVESDSK